MAPRTRRHAHVATASCPHVGTSPTVRDVGRPKTGQTPIQRFRMAAMRWTRLGKTARTEDKTASQVINELVEWYLRDRPTSQLTRPPRVELSEEERVAVEEAERKRIDG